MPGGPSFSIDVTDGGATRRTTVVVHGDVDIATSPELARVVRERLPDGPVLLDLRPVVFMDSSGVRAVNTLLGECAEHGWDLRLCDGLSAPVAQVLEMTGMMEILPLEDCGAP